MQIHPLPEGAFTVGKDKVFIPFDVDKDDLNSRSIGSILVEVQPFLIITETDYILLDTGLGFQLLNGKLQIHHNLALLNILPEQITKVILSHLHKDHSGGISYINEYQERVLTFPNAKYFIYQPEFDYAMANPTASYLTDEFSFLQNHSNAVFYTDKNGFLDSNIIEHRHSGGHCPEHQVILIHSDNETYFYAGDEGSQLRQMKIRYIAKYDFDGKLSADLRDQYAAEGKENNYTFLFYHDVNLPYSKL